ncbi:hypothetical protein NEHOM01_0322 [Nematocida homosporus]|uniref:uncharacterized protein n=1 Tax=Nematocida homosporus TaxID=1912981 RepID=UPI002220B97D|nr:uncharacterized protein NEHOM01_0322 [Nematocida homosporus]KAI5184720.1 hypothetical protein NEHOM01_0322 [Nematocida homosporus]
MRAQASTTVHEAGVYTPYDERPGETMAVDYHLTRDTIIPHYAPGVIADVDGEKQVCFDNGLCRSLGDRTDVVETRTGTILSPPAHRFPPGWQPQGGGVPGGPGDAPGIGSGVLPPFNPDNPSDGATDIHDVVSHIDTPVPVVQPTGIPGGPIPALPPISGMPGSVVGGGSYPGNLVSGFGDGPTKEDVLKILFSIGDLDSYLLFTGMSLDLPLQTFINSTPVTTDEVYAQDRKDYLAGELEGKGSSLNLENGLNTLYSSKMYFYIPKNALSLTMERGRLVYPEAFIKFLQFLHLDTTPFVSLLDKDGSRVYYITVYNATVALPNPQTPIVSQLLITSEGLAVSLLKVKRLEIDKGILVLTPNAYDHEDLANATASLQGFTKGQTTNPFASMTHIYYPHEQTGDLDDESTESDKMSGYSGDISESSDSDSDSQSDGSNAAQFGSSSSDGSDDSSSLSGSDSDSDGSSSSDDGSSPRHRGKGSGPSAQKGTKDPSRRRHGKGPDTIDGYLEQARMWRERAAAAAKAGYRKYALKKAKAYEKAAARLQREAYSTQLLEARQGSASSRKAAKCGIMAGTSSNTGSVSWFSGSRRHNKALVRVVSSKESSASASMSASASASYEASTKQAVSTAFSSSAASAVIMAHQSNEMHYKGVSAVEYATREIKHSLMGIAMQHAMFSVQGRMYKSQQYSSHGVRSAKSSTRWLTRRISKIITTRKYTTKTASKYMKNSATAASVAAAAAKEQAAASAAIASYRKAATASKKAAAATSMYKAAAAKGMTKAAKTYKAKAAGYRRVASRSTAAASRFGAAVAAYKAEKMQECGRQAKLFADRMKNPMANFSQADSVSLQQAVAQILTSSQIQLLSKALSPVQIQVLSKMLTPQQVQQTLVHIGAMSAEQLQLLLLRLQMKGLELQSAPIQPPMPLLHSAFVPIGIPALGVMNAIEHGATGTTVQMGEMDIKKYLLQSQFLMQGKENLLTPTQIEELRAQATAQSTAIKRLIAEIQSHKMEIEGQVRMKLAGGNRPSVSVCNPMLGMQAGMLNGVFDGLVSPPSLRLAGDVSLGRNSFNAIRQLLISPAVSSYIGMDPNILMQSLYKQTGDNDMMCLLTNSAAHSSAYSGISQAELSLIGARAAACQQKLSGVYGGSFDRLQQALLSAYNLVKSSSVKCNGGGFGASPMQIPICQIAPLLSA